MTTPSQWPELPDDERRRLQAMLAEDAASPGEAERLLATVTRLRRWSVPAADAQIQARLVRLLEVELSSRRQSPVTRLRQRIGEWWPLLILRAQARVVQREIWLASALVMVLGLVVTLSVYSAGEMLPFVLLAPVIAAVGMALLYNASLEQILELERGMPIPMRILLLARMALVFSFDCVLALIASLILVVAHSEIALWPLVLDWLAPMAFLSMLAFLISVLSRDSVAGVTLSLATWCVLVFRRFSGGIFERLPDLTSVQARPWLLMLALAFGLLALWLAGRESKPIGGLS
jgi:hypothetical protein